MAYDPTRHHRRSIRLPDHDYASPGVYYLTVCTHERRCLFGNVVHGQMQLNACGRIVDDEWRRTARVRSNVRLDAFVVMPNHIHGVIVITAPPDDGCRDTPAVCPYNYGTGPGSESNLHRRTFGGAQRGSIPTIMRQFKSIVTKRINRLRRTPGNPVWQRGYYEHIVRNRRALDNIRRYITDNPARWHHDRHRPAL